MARDDRGVFERPKDSGVWWIRYVDQFGELRRERVGPKSLAKATYQKRKNQIREGKFFPEMIQEKHKYCISFKKMAEDFLDKHSKLKKKSWGSDEQRLERCKDHFGNMPLSSIKKKQIEGFLETLITVDELSQATVNRYTALLKTLFNKALEWEECKENPVKGIKLFREQHRIRFLSDAEEVKLKEKFPVEFWPWVEIAMFTGMRRGEQFTLLWENVNFNTRLITIPMSKSGKKRFIPMNDRVMEILRDMPSRLKSSHVFVCSNGTTPMDGRNFYQRVFLPAIIAAEVKDFRWHDLRHTFASRLVMAGVNLKTVQELMGRESIEMTLKYAHLSPEHQVDAVQKLIQKATDTTTDTSDKNAENQAPEKVAVFNEKDKKVRKMKNMPPARIELATPGLGILCSIP